jgi:DNA-binding LacI/PurR family transcriptional regulator
MAHGATRGGGYCHGYDGDSAGASRRPRSKLPTIAEAAGRAGVSIATVSRVVSGRGRVREATRLRVEQAVAATGWTVDPAARQLAGGSGDEVVLAVAVARPPRTSTRSSSHLI